MNKPDELTELNTFEAWEPDKFAKDARYMRTIKSFTSGQIHGDVLDVGCGSRIFCELSRASTWTGLDISNRMLDSIHFSEEFTNKKIMQGDVLDLPFEDDSFDTVTAFFLLHHLGLKNKKQSAERVQKAFREISRVLRKDGRLIVAENCPGPIEAPYHLLFSPIFALGKTFFKTDMPYFWKPRAFLAFAEAAGFKPQAPYVHVPIVESIYQPATKITTPAFLNSNLIQKMTIFDFQI